METNLSSPRKHLFFRQATELVDGSDTGLLILTDTDERRQIAVPCGRDTLAQLKLWMDDMHGAGKRLPNVLLGVIGRAGVELRVDIDTIADGSYKALLTDTTTLRQVPIDVADAIVLSCLSGGSISVTMPCSLFMRQSSTFNGYTAGVALPINTLTVEMLQKAIDAAVKKENYELAAQLSNEMKARKKKKQ